MNSRDTVWRATFEYLIVHGMPRARRIETRAAPNRKHLRRAPLVPVVIGESEPPDDALDVD
jgi:hypothetical protein